ncbi:hypothetical protein LWI28_003616 [Acer negundo]|uniref:Uncharacterized protein n=1 Tax=Acer negundo TaxID=4023 RepID=A0AAD5P0Z3_ACENE|nr:hypothetical protein LWI28_003616 [Acer negundo]
MWDSVYDTLQAIGQRGSEDDSQDVKLDESTRMFITTWKEACKDHTADEVLERMILFYRSTYPKKKKNFLKRLTLLFSYNPFLELLNSAVASIKCGMWDSVCHTLQAAGQRELTTTYSGILSSFPFSHLWPFVLFPSSFIISCHFCLDLQNKGAKKVLCNPCVPDLPSRPLRPLASPYTFFAKSLTADPLPPPPTLFRRRLSSKASLHPFLY